MGLIHSRRRGGARASEYLTVSPGRKPKSRNLGLGEQSAQPERRVLGPVSPAARPPPRHRWNRVAGCLAIAESSWLNARGVTGAVAREPEQRLRCGNRKR